MNMCRELTLSFDRGHIPYFQVYFPREAPHTTIAQGSSLESQGRLA